MGTLYVVATPIGNLEDVTLRALRVLREVRLIAAEDTRTTRRLLARHNIATPTTSYYEHNKLAKLETILSALDTGPVALVSDAGTPGISDPGAELITAAIERGHVIVPIPGPSAVISALVASGLSSAAFTYFGFLPRRTRERRAALAAIATETRTLIGFEAPHRLRDTLRDALEILGDRPAVLAREMTKIHEEFRRTTLSALALSIPEDGVRGECTIVIAGAVPTAPDEEIDLASLLERALEAGGSGRDAVERVVAATGRPRRAVYQALIALEHLAQR